jgi:outer membrane protein assembly factor BamB
MSRFSIARGIAGLVLAGALSACGAGSDSLDSAFNKAWQDDHGRSIGQVYARLKPLELPKGTPVAVGVTADGLVGRALDANSAAWTHRASPDVRPTLTGSVVVFTGEGKAVALDARSGKELWSIDAEDRTLRGAGDDGSYTVLTLSHLDRSKPSLFLAVSRTGEVVTRLESTTLLGEPAAYGGVGFVPWSSQYVSLIELKNGREIGRLLMREVVSRAVNVGGTLYFGQLGLTRFDQAISSAHESAANRVGLPDVKLPANPMWMTDATEPTTPTATAEDRVRLFARPGSDQERLAIAGQRYAATYYRVALGLDAGQGNLIWTRVFPADLLGGAAGKNGFAFCDTLGNVHLVSGENGGINKPVELGARLRGCVVSLADLEVPAGDAPPAFTEQLREAIETADAEMAAVQELLLEELGKHDAPVVTKTLIELAGNTKLPPSLRTRAEKLLSTRRAGVEHMLAALETHYDFLSDVLRTPPVGALAEALAGLKELRAAPLLVRHLNDPATPPSDVARVAEALNLLAGAKEAEELSTFFALYRSTADQVELVTAVRFAAQAILRVGTDEMRRLVARAAEDPLTVPEVRQVLAGLISSTAAKDPG